MRTARREKSWGLAVVLAVVVFSVSFPGCGKKGDPIPPGLVPPPVVSDLKAVSVDRGVLLTWTMPDQNADVDKIRIFRSDLEIAGEECPGCPRQYNVIAELPPRFPGLVKEGERAARWLDDRTKPGWLYTYKIVFCDSYGNCGGESNLAEVKVRELP